MSWVGAGVEALLRAGPFTAASAEVAGISSDQLRWAVSRGRMHRIRRGVYCRRQEWEAADPAGRHLLLVRAEQLIRPGAVAAGLSAAVALGLPLPTVPSRAVLLDPRLRPGQGAVGHSGPATVRRRAWLADDEVTRLDSGLLVTTPARTVVDCSRHLERAWALAIGDAAMRQRNLDAATLRAATDRNPLADGHREAVWVAEHATCLAESCLESVARGVVILAGYPAPEPQVWIRTFRGDYRVDNLDDVGVVIESDGRIKYEQPGDVWAEKLREDALRDTGAEVIRFTVDDDRRRDRWLAAYRRARERACRRRAPLPIVRSRPR